jgi:hypothetical protein
MSQRNRGPRDRQRNTGHDTGEESLIWNEVQPKLNRINELEAKSKEVSRQIIEMEQNFKTKEANEAISEQLEIT